MGQFSASGRVQARVATVAARQHGVITTAQLHRCGAGSSTIRNWLVAGRLHRLHRGVHAVGHSGLSAAGEWMAAVLACGPGAALSHRSAAMLWRMLETRPGPAHVTVPGNGGRTRRRNVVVHRSTTLLPGHTTFRLAISVTGPARTLADMSRLGPPKEHTRALRQAEYLGLAIGEPIGADGTRSGLEARFLAFCTRHRLPPPEINARLGPYTVDFLWRRERMVVETDSYRTHGGSVAFEEDRERDLWLKGHGWEVARVTDRRLESDPRSVVAALQAILNRRQAPRWRESAP